MTEYDSDTESGIEQQAHDDNMTRYKWDILYLLAGGETHGLGVKARLERAYGEETNHGRLYPALDDLIELGVVKKQKFDKRTNLYALTDEGDQLVRERHRWHAELLHSANPTHVDYETDTPSRVRGPSVTDGGDER